MFGSQIFELAQQAPCLIGVHGHSPGRHVPQLALHELAIGWETAVALFAPAHGLGEVLQVVRRLKQTPEHCVGVAQIGVLFVRAQRCQVR